MWRRRLGALLLRSPSSSAPSSSFSYQQHHHHLIPTPIEKPLALNLLRLFASQAGSDGGRPFIAFILGGPGSGKGTQCTRIASDFGFAHVSAGDLLRNEISSGTDKGELILEIIKEGRIVPSEITVELIRKAIESSTAKRVLIDGFPRCEENRIAFEKISKGSIYQSSPKALYETVLENLKKDPNFVKLIKKIQYHNLFRIQPVTLKKRVMQFLIKCFDEKSKKLVINGQPIDIKPLIQKILGLPNCGLDVKFDKDYSGDPELRELLSDSGKLSYASRVLHLMFSEGLDELQRCILFILQACSHYLAPKSNRNMEREFLSLFKDVTLDQIKNMKWCDFSADFLIDGLVQYKTGTTIIKYCSSSIRKSAKKSHHFMFFI